MSNFSDKNYLLFSQYIHQHYGIHLDQNKRTLLAMKMDKALKYTGIETYEELYQRLEAYDPEIMNQFTNIVTTNTTEFFREIQHFEYIMKHFDEMISKIPRIMENKEIRVWSAGCSTGQEPYTIAMVLKEQLGSSYDIKILATDINQRVLSVALQGMYPNDIQPQVPKFYLLKYFEKVQNGYQVNQEIKNMVSFRSFNFTSDFSFKKGFDIIFCRNVMIYFDNEFQNKLVKKFERVLMPGGFFFIGHSETLLNKINSFQFIAPAIYRKSL
ncbi:MAG: cheR1 [Herbinix sp.]|jgi:chemotaxis protein methyltransferase CheR|nr:cheR1 [Herbinix sp.]